MQIERFIQLATSLPDGSAIQVKLTGALLKNLYDSLLHPPMSYLGDRFQYRTADGSNNVSPIEMSPSWTTVRHALTNDAMRVELLAADAWNGRHGLRQKCHAADPGQGVPGSD
jgi:hypothetical protein